MSLAALLAQSKTPDDVSPQSRIGWAIFFVVLLALAVGMFLNVRKARPEAGSEIELAPNRRPGISDDEFETRRLDGALLLGLVFLVVTAVTLPLYWLYEPARMDGAIEDFKQVAIGRGEKVYTTEAQCINCHGPKGAGGVFKTSILNDKGEFVKEVQWQAPALDTVLYRYSSDEVKYILNYGRPGTPMPAWGALGGGPLNTQQIDNTVAYLFSIQRPASEWKAALDKEVETVCIPEKDKSGSYIGKNPKCTKEGGAYATLGEAVFNLGRSDGFAAGAASCGRCHTKGWSYNDPQTPGGGGAIGPNLTGGSELRQFPTSALQIDFVTQGSAEGKGFGLTGQGSGKMPGFGFNPNAEAKNALMAVDQVMYTPEQIDAVVEYERGL